MLVILFLSLIPLVFWVQMVPISIRFFDLGATFTSIGQITGLLGMALFSLNLILAGRFKFLDKYFKGLDKVYARHHLIGATAFSLLLFHPLFLVFNYIRFSLREAALFFVPFLSVPRTWGIISLLLMIVLISLTFYAKIKYQNWKLSHKFMVVVFIFAVLHTIYVPSDISRNNLLRYYVLGLAVFGLASGIYRAFLSNFLVPKLKYKVKNVNQLNESVIEVEMESVEERLDFKAGQFIFVSFKNGGVSRESHPFSISSGEDKQNLKITVKSLGDFTGELKSLRVGSLVEVEGPFGNFSYENTNGKNQIWIAGGIGITPFISMAKSLKSGYNVDLYYCVKDQREAILLNELQKMAQSNSNFKVNSWCSVEKGFINSGVIASTSGGVEGKDILICGPAVFMESLKKQFLCLGVKINNIHYEKFNFYDN